MKFGWQHDGNIHENLFGKVNYKPVSHHHMMQRQSKLADSLMGTQRKSYPKI